MNITAWVLRFINNAKPNAIKFSCSLTYDELSKAMNKILLCVQEQFYEKEINNLLLGNPPPKNSKLRNLDPFCFIHGLLRIEGCLQNADLSYDSKQPIIIPNGHVDKLIILFQHKFLRHADVHTLMSTIEILNGLSNLEDLPQNLEGVCSLQNV